MTDYVFALQGFAGLGFGMNCWTALHSEPSAAIAS